MLWSTVRVCGRQRNLIDCLPSHIRHGRAGDAGPRDTASESPPGVSRDPSCEDPGSAGRAAPDRPHTPRFPPSLHPRASHCGRVVAPLSSRPRPASRTSHHGSARLPRPAPRASHPRGHASPSSVPRTPPPDGRTSPRPTLGPPCASRTAGPSFAVGVPTRPDGAQPFPTTAGGAFQGRPGRARAVFGPQGPSGHVCRRGASAEPCRRCRAMAVFPERAAPRVRHSRYVAPLIGGGETRGRRPVHTARHIPFSRRLDARGRVQRVETAVPESVRRGPGRTIRERPKGSRGSVVLRIGFGRANRAVRIG
ncbi:hypothetical protein H4W34_007801 [Actinomadura algeriensis]|uniref:Uncharacterized protein n=1 Tax=Actinomadura algeriensis TaxID=1679523 RepID=A0ABR9K556_9ACTN|nr:hypothetical protein [Actinomadura algeriensis]